MTRPQLRDRRVGEVAGVGPYPVDRFNVQIIPRYQQGMPI